MMELTKAYVETVMDDMILLNVCAKALIVEEDDVNTRRDVSHLIESVAIRLGHTIDILDHVIDEKRFALEGAVTNDDVIEIGDELLRVWERFSGRKRRAVDNGDSGEN